jgi:hypothetical protein
MLNVHTLNRVISEHFNLSSWVSDAKLIHHF